EWQMLGYITSGLKDLAGTLQLPVYSACQENRNNVSSSDNSVMHLRKIPICGHGVWGRMTATVTVNV
ncbi:MAG: hypothetical protein IJW23_13060, partial [Lentisphaeria bacterium]|nr:hypothetical protein [Lentisphaeria bacterium]